MEYSTIYSLLFYPCMNRQGGKKKPLKTPKKQEKDLDEHDVAFIEKERERKKQEQELKNKILSKSKSKK